MSAWKQKRWRWRKRICPKWAVLSANQGRAWLSPLLRDCLSPGAPCSPRTPLIPSRQMLASPGSLAPSADGASLSRHLPDRTPPRSLPLAALLSGTKQSWVVCILTQRRKAGLCFSCLGLISFPLPFSPMSHTRKINSPPWMPFFPQRLVTHVFTWRGIYSAPWAPWEQVERALHAAWGGPLSL